MYVNSKGPMWAWGQAVPALDAAFEDRIECAKYAAFRTEDDDLTAGPIEELIAEVRAWYEPNLIEVFPASAYWRIKGYSDPKTPTLDLEFRIPGRGAAKAILESEVHPRASVTTTSRSTLEGAQFDYILNAKLVRYDNETDQDLREEIASTFNSWKAELLDSVESANELITINARAVDQVVRRTLEERARLRGILVEAAEHLSIPLSPRVAGGLPIPLTANRLTLTAVRRAAETGVPEYQLSEKIADGVVQLIRDFARALESLPVTANKLIGADEESIRDVLLFILNANYSGIATGESFRGEGKVDILVRWRNRDCFVAECKVWGGQNTMDQALDQILTRYALWRNSRVAIVLFIRNRASITRALDAARARITDHPRFISELKENEYIFTSKNDQEVSVRLSFIPVVIPAQHSGSGE